MLRLQSDGRTLRDRRAFPIAGALSQEFALDYFRRASARFSYAGTWCQSPRIYLISLGQNTGESEMRAVTSAFEGSGLNDRFCERVS